MINLIGLLSSLLSREGKNIESRARGLGSYELRTNPEETLSADSVLG